MQLFIEWFVNLSNNRMTAHDNPRTDTNNLRVLGGGVTTGSLKAVEFYRKYNTGDSMDSVRFWNLCKKSRIMNVIQLDLQVVDPNKLVNIIYAVHPNSPVIVGFMIFLCSFVWSCSIRWRSIFYCSRWNIPCQLDVNTWTLHSWWVVLELAVTSLWVGTWEEACLTQIWLLVRFTKMWICSAKLIVYEQVGLTAVVTL